jgi:putative ABC transport system permease protein
VVRVVALPSIAVFVLVRLAAWLFAPFRLGRLLRTVCIPRLQEHPVRTTLTVFGIALGVAVVVAVGLVNRSIADTVAATFDEVGGKADLQVSAGSTGFDQVLLDRIRSVHGVDQAAPTLQQTVVLRDPRAHGQHILLLGVDILGPADSRFREYSSPDLAAIKADPLVFLNSPHNIILTRTLAERFGYRLHDHIPIGTPRGVDSFEIWGFIDDAGIGRAFGGSLAIMDYQAMQVAFERGTNVDSVDIAVARGADAADVASALRTALGSGFSIERPARKNDRVADMLIGLRTGLTMGSLIAMLVGLFLIYNTMTISVVQRRREIGVLRALGALRGEVLQLWTLEGFLLGLVGGTLGVAFGIGLAHALLDNVARSVSELYLPVAASPIELDPGLIIQSYVAGVVATTLAAAIPARLASRVSPMDTLRAGTPVRAARPGLSWTRVDAAALALLALLPGLLYLPPRQGVPLGPMAAGALLMLAGALLTPRLVQANHAALAPIFDRMRSIELRLANDNLPRDIGRSASTAAALMLAVAMATCFAVFIGSFVASTLEWMDQSVPADLFITSAARFGGRTNVPLADGLQRRFAAIDGVAAVERVRFMDGQYRGVPIVVVSTDVGVFGRRSHLTMLEGSQREALRRVRGGDVLVSENFSRRFGVHLGDEIELGTKRGTRGFRIAGVDIDYTNDRGTVLFDRAVGRELWGDSLVDTYKVYLRRNRDPLAVQRKIERRFGAKFDLFVLTNSEMKAAISRLLDQIFAVMRTLEAVALLIAVLGVVNALFASVLDRVREIGVLRAVGMLKRQTSAMILIEGGLIGLSASVGGLIVGCWLGEILLMHINLVETGWYFPYRPAWLSIAGAVVTVIAASTIAASYAARRAASLVVPDALAYE